MQDGNISRLEYGIRIFSCGLLYSDLSCGARDRRQGDQTCHISFRAFEGKRMVVVIAGQRGFEDLTSPLRDGLLWVKLSAPCCVSNQALLYEDLKPLVRYFVVANPARFWYSSDWQHMPKMKIRIKEEERLRHRSYCRLMVWCG